METECSDSRFGKVAIEKNYITMENLINASRERVIRESKESVCLELGEVMIELGYMLQEQVDEVLHIVSEN